MLRRLKLSYILYNFFQKKQLQHNAILYKKHGINKKYYSSVSSADFEQLDEKDFVTKSEKANPSKGQLYQQLDQASQKSIVDFDDNGYCILKNYLAADAVDKINGTIDELRQAGKLKFKFGNKLMFAIHKSQFLFDIWTDKSLLELLSHLIQGDAKLFSSINFMQGSQQKSHSDSIHMTTFPLGGLLGVWLALEDITLENGPLHYFPKSHKLPYYLNKDYDNVGGKFFIGNKGYTAYEKMLEEKIKERGITKQVFTAKKGDLFIWHANLLHGGEPHIDKDKTRKSMVMHYFDVNRICYHEITQRPALMNKPI